MPRLQARPAGTGPVVSGGNFRDCRLHRCSPAILPLAGPHPSANIGDLGRTAHTTWPAMFANGSRTPSTAICALFSAVRGSRRSILYTDPEALSPFDRSDTNGFRCVRNLGSLPAAAAHRPPCGPRLRGFQARVSDDVFRAYKLLYAYPKTPLNAKVEGVVEGNRRLARRESHLRRRLRRRTDVSVSVSAEDVRPPYQTVLFFPSARVIYASATAGTSAIIKFFDYVVQSGRAVMYPVYEDTYERQAEASLPASAG